MRPTSLPPPSRLLAALACLALFSAPALGQRSSSAATTSAPSATPRPESSTPSPSPSPTRGGSASSSTARVSITNTGTLETADPTGIPTITGPSQATTGDVLTGFPTLTRGGAVPTYPPPAVPPTDNAPFMQQSSMPEGTVFIVVGAILGALGLAILLWRGIVSLLLHRSVERAAKAQHSANNKAGFPAPPAPFYKYTDQDSTKSLAGGAQAAPGRGVRRTNRGPIPSATPSHSNLFFSPTAANNAAGNRASTFLPSGFYASNNAGSSPANHTNSISLNNLQPDMRPQPDPRAQYANASRNTLAHSDPDSPHYPARRDVSGMSTSSLNLTSQLLPGQRAPSAYLEDLLADDPAALPPPHMGPLTGPRASPGGGHAGGPMNRF